MQTISKAFIYYLFLALFGCVSTGTGQDIENKKQSYPFTKISQEKRARFIERLQQFTEYNLKKDWANAYRLISEQDKKRFWSTHKFEVYQNEHKFMRLKKFTAQYIESNTGEPFITITGCGNWTGMRVQAGISAYWENNDWFFGDFYRVSACTHCVYYKCKH